MIAVISHVADLAERPPSRIQVVKSVSDSIIAIEPPSLKNLTRNPPFFETSPPPRAVIAFQPIPRAFLTLMTRNENLRDDRNPRKSR